MSFGKNRAPHPPLGLRPSATADRRDDPDRPYDRYQEPVLPQALPSLGPDHQAHPAEVYYKATSATAAQFLATIEKALPFPIRSIQVDGGSEFMKHFEDACQAKGIQLYVLPPNRPQYNGGVVERMNRTMREDLYARKDLIANDIAQFQAAVYQASRTYIHYRPHQTLDNLTPAQCFARLQAAQSQNVMNECSRRRGRSRY